MYFIPCWSRTYELRANETTYLLGNYRLGNYIVGIYCVLYKMNWQMPVLEHNVNAQCSIRIILFDATRGRLTSWLRRNTTYTFSVAAVPSLLCAARGIYTRADRKNCSYRRRRRAYNVLIRMYYVWYAHTHTHTRNIVKREPRAKRGLCDPPSHPARVLLHTYTLARVVRMRARDVVARRAIDCVQT